MRKSIIQSHCRVPGWESMHQFQKAELQVGGVGGGVTCEMARVNNVGRVENGDFELFVWLYSFCVGFLCVETRNAKD